MVMTDTTKELQTTELSQLMQGWLVLLLTGTKDCSLFSGSELRTPSCITCCCCCSVTQLSLTLQPHGWQHTRLPCHSDLPEFAQTRVHWASDAIQPSHPLSSLFLLPSVFLNIRVFSNESVLCIRWPKYWSFSFSISPSNEYSGLISFRMDWFDLLAVQGTLKSLL